jgi:hypothetical protein
LQGSAAYVFALVTEDGLSGHTGPMIVSRFTHDSRAALTALDEPTADVLLPGHGAPFSDGLQTATEHARRLGVH